jgi:hypothetical protein
MDSFLSIQRVSQEMASDLSGSRGPFFILRLRFRALSRASAKAMRAGARVPNGWKADIAKARLWVSRAAADFAVAHST